MTLFLSAWFSRYSLYPTVCTIEKGARFFVAWLPKAVYVSYQSGSVNSNHWIPKTMHSHKRTTVNAWFPPLSGAGACLQLFVSPRDRARLFSMPLVRLGTLVIFTHTQQETVDLKHLTHAECIQSPTD